jgi:hypothetical protein
MLAVTDATLTRIQKNQVLQLILGYGPPPSDFQWTEKQQEEASGSYRVSVLTHRPTGYFAVFGAHSITVSPGIKTKVEKFWHEDDWANKTNICTHWLVDLQEEVTAPDLWATIGQEKALSTAASSASLDNRPFTAAEQSLIATKLAEIKAYLLEGEQFDHKQAETVEREFAYLRESSERLGRKDWLNIVLGGLFGLAVTLALDPEKARGLLRLAGTVFQTLWEMGQRRLQ